MQIIYLWIAGILNLCLLKTMNELGLQVISRMVNNDRIWNFTGEKKPLMVSITSLKSLKLLRWVNMAKR